jgi:hypothetical protein
MPTSQVRMRHVFVLTADRRTDLVGRTLLYVHPTISMTLGTMKKIPVMTVATAIDDVKSHKTHIFIVTFALYFGPKIKQSLICFH